MSAWLKYMEQDVQTNHPLKNIILIYEGCKKKIQLAEEEVGRYRYSTAREHLDKVDLLMYELQIQLNPNLDKEIYENLFNLYEYMQREVEKMKNTYDFKEKEAIFTVLDNLIEAYKGVLNNA